MITPSKEFWKIFKETNGALSCAEALAIMNIAAQAHKGGTYMELGTHKGKSALAAAYGFSKINNELSKPSGFLLVDTEFGNTINSDEIYDKLKSISNLMAVNRSRNTSVQEIVLHDNYSYVFVDSGSHGDGLPMREATLLEDRMIQGGIIAFHDYKNQFVEVEGAYNYLLSTGKYEEIIIDWQPIFDYVKEHDLESKNNSWHLYPELPHPPNFVGALRRK